MKKKELRKENEQLRQRVEVTENWKQAHPAVSISKPPLSPSPFDRIFDHLRYLADNRQRHVRGDNEETTTD